MDDPLQVVRDLAKGKNHGGLFGWRVLGSVDGFKTDIEALSLNSGTAYPVSVFRVQENDQDVFICTRIPHLRFPSSMRVDVAEILFGECDQVPKLEYGAQCFGIGSNKEADSLWPLFIQQTHGRYLLDQVRAMATITIAMAQCDRIGPKLLALKEKAPEKGMFH